MIKLVVAVLFVMQVVICAAQPAEIEKCNISWTSQSRHSGESMPCGGGDVGLNVWVEKGLLYFYVSRSGTFDENNAFLKLGRVSVKLSPNPFEGVAFKQELKLKEGYVSISGTKGKHHAEIDVWVDVFKPVVHVDVRSNQPVMAEAGYESWRYKDRPMKGRENNANAYKWAPQPEVVTYKDSIDFENNAVVFYHQNKNATVFDVTVKQQGLDSVKHLLFNPLQQLVFGGTLKGKNFIPGKTYNGQYVDTDFKGWGLKAAKPSTTFNLALYLHTSKAADNTTWKQQLDSLVNTALNNNEAAWQKTRQWWQQLWGRSFVYTGKNNAGPLWQTGRNYQLFRYMLACNAYGNYPTKFNGGLFTVDPVFTDTSMHFTPDHRNWGGGTFTAQNQRLVYFPMLRSGDMDMMKPQFDFYLRLLKNAELRSQVYWHHNGACFTEQMENFGLPNPAEYEWKRPNNFDKGIEYNAWLEYLWDTVLEFCLMMLETEKYEQRDIREYLPFIESCLRFFDEHYQWLAGQRGRKLLDGNNKLVLYPGSAAETYKMACNPATTVAALTVITQRMLQLPYGYVKDSVKQYLEQFALRLPALSFARFNGHVTIAPAKSWERINNVESPQLYPVYPWGLFGVGKAGLDTAINTFKYDTNVIRFKSHIGWKQDNIFAARLGLTDEAYQLTLLKLKDSERRFPAFWGPGFDWVPDHNWGGSGMIGLQEMLLQTDDRRIFLFPAWPKEKDVHFKLHAPYNTTVEAATENGKLIMLKVLPQHREKDVVNMLK